MADSSVIIEVEADDKAAEKELNRLSRKIKTMETQLQKTGSARAPIVEQLRTAQKEAVAAYNEVERLQKELAESQRLTSVDASPESVDPLRFAQELEKQERITAEIKQQQTIMAEKEKTAARLEAQEAKLLAKEEQLTAELHAQEEAAGAIQRQMIAASTKSMDDLKAGAESVTKGFNKSLKSLVKCGLGIRTLYALFGVLRRALTDGVKNLVQYDAKTNASVSALVSSLGTLKNSLATAFAPILNVVAPILTRFINLLATAASYVSMFFAVLSGGSSYKRAIAVQEDYADSLNNTAGAAGGAGAAAKEAEKNFSGLDEISTWQSTADSGGGGGGAGGGSEALFEDVAIENADAIKELMKDILWYAGAIGAALATWTIARAFGANLLTALGLAILLGGAVLTVKGYLDAWQNGIDLKNMKEMFSGLLLVVTGLGLAIGSITTGMKMAAGVAAAEAAAAGVAAGITAGAIAALVGGIALVVLGLKEWIQTGELSAEACAVLTTGILLIGGAITVLTGSFIPLIVAAVVALVLTIIAYWDEISAWTTKIWNSVWSFITTTWTNITTGVKNAVTSLVNTVTSKFQLIRTNITDKLTNAKETALGIFDDIKSGIAEKIENAQEKVREGIDKIKSFFNFSWSLPKLKTPHFSWGSTPASGWIASVLSALGLPTSLPKLNVSWYARGGIVDGATLFGAGEAGKEAVVPLERHTEWLDMVAGRIADILAKVHQRSADNVIADKLDGISTAIYALADSFHTLPVPAVATGSVIPPRSIVDDSEIKDLVADLKGLLAGVPAQRQTEPTYNVAFNVGGRTLFRAVLKEGRAEQTRTGENPFEL